MSQEIAKRIAAVNAASDALGDPADFFETHETTGKPETAEGLAGAFGGTKPAGKTSTTTQVFARDLLAVAEWIAAGPPADEQEQED